MKKNYVGYILLLIICMILVKLLINKKSKYNFVLYPKYLKGVSEPILCW
jgi:hypothetical protein